MLWGGDLKEFTVGSERLSSVGPSSTAVIVHYGLAGLGLVPCSATDQIVPSLQ